MDEKTNSVTVLYVQEEQISKPRGNSFFESKIQEEKHCQILSQSKNSVENLRYIQRLDDNFSDYHLSENSPEYHNIRIDMSVNELLELFKSEIQKLGQKSQNSFNTFENEIVQFRQSLKVQKIVSQSPPRTAKNASPQFQLLSPSNSVKQQFSQKKLQNLRDLDHLIQKYDNLQKQSFFQTENLEKFFEKIAEQISQKFDDNENQMRFLNDNISAYKIESERLEKFNQTLRLDLSKSQANLTEYESETKSNVMQFIKDNDNDKLCQNLQEKLEKMEKMINNKETNIQKLQQELTQCQNESCTEINSLQNEVHILKNQIKYEIEKSEKLKDKIVQMKQAQGKLLRMNTNELKFENQDLKKQVQYYGKKVKQLRNENEILNNGYGQLQKDYAFIQQRLQEIENNSKLIPSEMSLHHLYQEQECLANEMKGENIGQFLYDDQYVNQTYKSRPNSEGSIVKQSLSCTLSHSPDVIKKSVQINSTKKSIGHCSPIRPLKMDFDCFPIKNSFVQFDSQSDQSPQRKRKNYPQIQIQKSSLLKLNSMRGSSGSIVNTEEQALIDIQNLNKQNILKTNDAINRINQFMENISHSRTYIEKSTENYDCTAKKSIKEFTGEESQLLRTTVNQLRELVNTQANQQKAICQKLKLHEKIQNKRETMMKSLEKAKKPPLPNKNGFQNFITDLFAKKEWKRYQEILTNETTFDSNALLNKYRKSSGQPSKGPIFVKSARDTPRGPSQKSIQIINKQHGRIKEVRINRPQSRNGSNV